MRLKSIASILAVTFLMTGCAFLHSKTSRTYSVMPGGIVTNIVEKTVCTAYTLWDANSSLSKFRNQSSPSSYGSNSFAPGTYMTELNQSATSSNVNDLVSSVVGAAVTAAIKSAKP